MIKRIFLSKKAAVVSILLIFCVSVGNFFAGNMFEGEGRFDLFDFFDTALRLTLAMFLFHSYVTHNILGMQAGACGLLISMVYYEGNYVLADLLSRQMDEFISQGFWGSFYLAGELMQLLLEALLAVNHFVIFVLKKSGFLRLAFNRVTLIILVFFQLFQVFVVSRLPTEPIQVVMVLLYALESIAIYLLSANAGFMLVLDANERS